MHDVMESKKRGLNGREHLNGITYQDEGYKISELMCLPFFVNEGNTAVFLVESKARLDANAVRF